MKKRFLFLSCLALQAFYAQAQTQPSYSATEATTTSGVYHYKFFNGSGANSALRWAMGMIQTESAGNAGSNFRISRLDDNGNYLQSALGIERSTGKVDLFGGFRVNTILSSQTTGANPGYGAGITGSGTADANQAVLGFYESNGTIRQGYVGKGFGLTGNFDMYLVSEVGNVALGAKNGYINLVNGTSNIIKFNTVGYGAPTFNTRSLGTKIVLHDAVGTSATNMDYAIGLEKGAATYGWFAVPTNSTAHGWNFYGGTTVVANLDGAGNFSTTGNMVVGNSTAQTTLKVNGEITARKVKVTQSGWPDYVFANDYNLPSLQEISRYIKENHRLPGVPAAAEVEKSGLDVGEMQKTMMEKIEQLTLHLIRLDEENRQLKEELEKLKASK
jgi:hypothetical protein